MPGMPVYKSKVGGIYDALNLPTLPKDRVLIADSVVPPVDSHPTVVISSPGRLFKKEHKDTLNYYDAPCFLPLPTADEILDMHRVAFPHLGIASVQQRLELWGPIPRNVLVRVMSKQQRRLWNSICEMSPGAIEQAAQSVMTDSTGDELPYRMFVVHARGAAPDSMLTTSDPAYYDKGPIEFASHSIARWFLERLVELQHWGAAFFLDSTSKIARTGTLRGLTFEDLALQIVQRGGTFPSRQLVSPRRRVALSSLLASQQGDDDVTKAGSPQQRLIPEQMRHLWLSYADLHALASSSMHLGKMLVPVKKDMAALDALLWDVATQRHISVNFTAAPEHDIKLIGLTRAVTALGWTKETGWPQASTDTVCNKRILHVFVVPPERFRAGWRHAQTIVEPSVAEDASGLTTAEQLTLKAVRECVEQHVICVETSLTVALAWDIVHSRARSPSELIMLLDK